MWPSITINYLTGPRTLPAKLISPRTCNFSVVIYPCRWKIFRYGQDNGYGFVRGALTYFNLATREWLRRHYHGRSISRGPEAPVSLPPRSPDLNTIDFCLWRSMKNAVYKTADTKDQLGN